MSDLIETLISRYRLGHPEIDRQHERLLTIAAELGEEPSESGHRYLVADLLAYATEHFEAELAMASILGVDTRDHARRHHELLSSLIELSQSRTMDGWRETRVLLAHWITSHIDVDDRALVAAMGIGRDPRRPA